MCDVVLLVDRINVDVLMHMSVLESTTEMLSKNHFL